VSQIPSKTSQVPAQLSDTQVPSHSVFNRHSPIEMSETETLRDGHFHTSGPTYNIERFSPLPVASGLDQSPNRKGVKFSEDVQLSPPKIMSSPRRRHTATKPILKSSSPASSANSSPLRKPNGSGCLPTDLSFWSSGSIIATAPGTERAISVLIGSCKVLRDPNFKYKFEAYATMNGILRENKINFIKAPLSEYSEYLIQETLEDICHYEAYLTNTTNSELDPFLLRTTIQSIKVSSFILSNPDLSFKLSNTLCSKIMVKCCELLTNQSLGKSLSAALLQLIKEESVDHKVISLNPYFAETLLSSVLNMKYFHSATLLMEKLFIIKCFLIKFKRTMIKSFNSWFPFVFACLTDTSHPTFFKIIQSATNTLRECSSQFQYNRSMNELTNIFLTSPMTSSMQSIHSDTSRSNAKGIEVLVQNLIKLSSISSMECATAINIWTQFTLLFNVFTATNSFDLWSFNQLWLSPLAYFEENGPQDSKSLLEVFKCWKIITQYCFFSEKLNSFPSNSNPEKLNKMTLLIGQPLAVFRRKKIEIGSKLFKEITSYQDWVFFTITKASKSINDPICKQQLFQNSFVAVLNQAFTGTGSKLDEAGSELAVNYVPCFIDCSWAPLLPLLSVSAMLEILQRNITLEKGNAKLLESYLTSALSEMDPSTRIDFNVFYSCWVKLTGGPENMIRSFPLVEVIHYHRTSKLPIKELLRSWYSIERMQVIFLQRLLDYSTRENDLEVISDVVVPILSDGEGIDSGLIEGTINIVTRFSEELFFGTDKRIITKLFKEFARENPLPVKNESLGKLLAAEFVSSNALPRCLFQLLENGEIDLNQYYNAIDNLTPYNPRVSGYVYQLAMKNLFLVKQLHLSYTQFSQVDITESYVVPDLSKYATVSLDSLPQSSLPDTVKISQITSKDLVLTDGEDEEEITNSTVSPKRKRVGNDQQLKKIKVDDNFKVHEIMRNLQRTIDEGLEKSQREELIDQLLSTIVMLRNLG